MDGETLPSPQRTRPQTPRIRTNVVGHQQNDVRLGEENRLISAKDVELRIGARVLLSPASFQVAAGDRIGFVGRNGAGKTTLTKVLAGESQPTSGSVSRKGTIGYLPQDPRTGDLEQLAMERILEVRDLA